MLGTTQLDFIKEILHRLEMNDSVSIEELIYLYKQAQLDSNVDRWLNKLLKIDGINAEENNSSYDDIAA